VTEKAPIPDLPPKLAATLDAFRAEGVELPAQAIVWLATIRARCDGRGDGGVPWVMGAPIVYGGVSFWPLHLLAESWWLRAVDLVSDSPADGVAVYLYAHAHSAPGDASLRMLMDPAAIRRTATEWRDTLPIHAGQVEELCKRIGLLDGDASGVPEPRDKTKGEPAQPRRNAALGFVAILSKAFPGLSPEYWLTGISAHDARAMLAEASSGGEWATSSERTAAQKDYLRAVRWLWLEQGHHG